MKRFFFEIYLLFINLLGLQLQLSLLRYTNYRCIHLCKTGKLSLKTSTSRLSLLVLTAFEQSM